MPTESNELSPVPQHDPPIGKFGSVERFVNSWMQWFIELRTKVNVINALLVNFSNLSGTGFPALNGSVFSIRSMATGPGVDVANGNGATGNPTFSFNSSTALVPFIGSATYQNVQDIFDLLFSPGIITGGEVTALNPTTVRVLAGTGVIRILDDNISTLKFFNFAQADFPIAVVQSTRFYAVDYNAGNPIVVEATVDTWDRDTQLPLGSGFRFDGTLNVTANPYRVGDIITNFLQRLDAVSPVQKDNSVGGLALGVSGTRNVTVSPGKLWARVSDFPHTAKNSSVNTMFTAFFNGVNLTVTSGVTQWDNLNFNNTGTGTLQVMGNNKWANLWFYVSFDGTKYGFVYGTNEYNSLGAASLEGQPAFLNQNFHNQLYLLGRFIFQKSAATPGSIETNEAQGFVPGAVNDHNQLTGLQGGIPGTPGEFYHLAAAQYNALAPLLQGTYAARPAAAAANNGFLYYATDVRESYRSNGVAWTVNLGAGNELGYAERTSVFTTASLTLVDVPGMSVTFTAGERPVSINFGSTLRNQLAGEFTRLALILDGSPVAQLLTQSTFYYGLSRQYRPSLFTPGTSHTVKLQVLTTAAFGPGIAEVFGDPVDRTYLQVVNI